MIVKLTLEKARAEARTLYIEVESTDDILLRGTAFKKFDFEARRDGPLFTLTARPPDGDYPRMFLTNNLGRNPDPESVNAKALPEGMSLLDFAAIELLAEGNEDAT